MVLLHPSLKKSHNLSGISYHILFDSKLVNSLIKLVEHYHRAEPNPFWKIYLDKVTIGMREYSGASEDEIYFTYVYLYHRQQIKIRNLKWTNSGHLDLETDNDFMSVHWYLRK